MARRLRAFISYRRHDSFMVSDAGDPSASLIDDLTAALRALGFTDVFVDTDQVRAGDHFEGRIHRAITECDLFIELIGRKWLELLHEKIENNERDILRRELVTALKLEKDVVPLLVDRATMPRQSQLPGSMRPLSKIDYAQVGQGASADDFERALRRTVDEVLEVHRIGRRWGLGYALASLLIWILSAIAPNVAGLGEFGVEAWIGMATTWSGLFIWPVFFLPFILLALWRPFKTLVEAILNADGTQSAFVYATPLIFGTLAALGAGVVEASAPQVPWTVHPKLQADCDGEEPAPLVGEARERYQEDLKTLAAYGSSGVVPEAYRDAFWMKTKCWPNVFFYLTVPVGELRMDDAYRAERTSAQEAFRHMLGSDSKEFKGTDAPYSRLFVFYALGISLMMWVLMVGVLMAIVYAIVTIRRARDGKELRVPSEDAYLCLTYAFVTMMVWVPFRMTTNSVKTLYSCADLSGDCAPSLHTFYRDGGFGLALLMAYSALTMGLLWRHRRLLLAFLGTVLVAGIVAAAWSVARHHDLIWRVSGYWQFWIVLSILVSLVLLALWYQYNPVIVRLREFRDYDETSEA